MTRMNPLRRLAASAAILGVTALGGVALAAPAMAAPAATPATAKVAPVKSIGTIALPALNQMTLGDLMGSLHAADGMLQLSPLPIGPVDVKVGPLKLTFQPDVAQTVQNVIANFYQDLGYQVTFNEKGVLVIGKKLCDATKSATFNKGCVNPATDARF